MAKNEIVFILAAVYIYSTVIVILIGGFSTTILSGSTYPYDLSSNGLWEKCYRYSNIDRHCSEFDWAYSISSHSNFTTEVKVIKAFGAMSIISGVFLFVAPILFFCVDVKVMSIVYISSYVFMGISGAIACIVLDRNKSEIRLTEWYSIDLQPSYGWGAYVSVVGVGMTSAVIFLPFLVFCPRKYQRIQPI